MTPASLSTRDALLESAVALIREATSPADVTAQFVLRPEGCAGWLGRDPRDRQQRDPLLERFGDFVHVPGDT